MILLTLKYLFVLFVLSTDSCILTGFMNAPCVDGLDTKSQQINSKSSCTKSFPPALTPRTTFETPPVSSSTSAGPLMIPRCLSCVPPLLLRSRQPHQETTHPGSRAPV